MSTKLKTTKGKNKDRLFTFLVKASAIIVFCLLVGIILSLLVESLPAMRKLGFSFLYTTEWNPAKEKFGALVPIVGTLVTSAIALVIAAPVSFFTAMFLVFVCPARFKNIIKQLLELLAAVPSIVFGMFGLMVFAPVFSQWFQIPLQHVIGSIPFIGQLVEGPAWGLGLLPAGVILAIMIIPFITSTIVDMFDQAPAILIESAYGLGLTRWESIWHVVVPHSRTGIVSGFMLGLGRALGETMAVAFVIGNTFNLNGVSLYQPLSTITSVIANNFAEASSELYISSLLELGLILFLITFFVLLISKFLIKISAKKEGN